MPPGSEPSTRPDTAILRRWVTGAGVALILLIIAADSYEAWQDYRRVIVDNEHVQLALSRALTEQTARMVQEVDVVLSDFAGWIESAEGMAADEPAIVARLNAKIVSLPFVSSAALTGADGRVRVSTLADERGQTLKDLDVFEIPTRAAADSLYIDRPRSDADNNVPSFALSRRINAKDGVAGVIVARVAFEYLAGFYAGVNVTPDTSIRLARSDGVTLVHYPASLSPMEDVGLPPSAPVSGTSALTDSRGKERIEVTRKVDAYPILVEVSRPRSSVLSPWIQEERSSAARTLSLAVLATLLLLSLRSALNRQAHMDQERRRLEQELAGIQRVEALGFLAASVAHDFNNVLTAIIGYAELSRGMAEGEPEVSANMDRLLAATERARLLVRRVLTFDPRRSLSYRPTALEPIIVEVSEQIQATLPAAINFEVQGLGGSATILGDATEIHQVLMNLCTNAVHAMPAGGALRIRVESLDVSAPRTLALGQLRAGRWICVTIADSGMGLATDQVMSMFEPFYTTRQHAHGTGIGLTVVRNIISRMNGALNVDSRLGSGTRMLVYWPALAAQTALARHPRGEGDGSGQTILVVDDERELVALTEELLASLSYEPVGFSDARAAVEAFRSDPKRFDALLTDERMQSLRGLDVAKLIREIDPLLPIILMTGHRDAQIDGLARAVGISEIIDKPLRVQTLREALGRHLHAAAE